MLIRGLFLRSRVGRRVFWSLLAAATVPLLLFAAVSWQTFDGLRHTLRQRAAHDHLKHVGNRLHDRLNAARGALAAHAAASHDAAAWTAPAAADADVRRMLERIATVDTLGHRAGGDPVLAEGWGDRPTDAAPRVLWWQPSPTKASATLLLSHADPHGRGTWLAEVNPDWVWSDYTADGLAAGACAVDAAGGAVLRCAPDTTARQVADAPQWRLFMGAAFGSPDWILGGRTPPPLASSDNGLVRGVVLCALATLLLIAMIGMVLVRRTMVPLERLAAGTRRLADGDWSARVDTGGADEFGALAGSFNQMAARIGRQMEALAVQSAIDREILGALDLADVMRHVAQRLQELQPAARACVVARTPAGAWAVHTPDDTPPRPLASGAPAAQVDGAHDDGLLVRPGAGSAQPPWVRELPEHTTAPRSAVCWVPARWNGQTVALLVYGGVDAPMLDADARREIGGLRDRVAVALAAAEREHHLVERAVRDALTGLANRHGLHDACIAAYAGAVPPAMSLLMIDLDGYKEVNDTLGHPIGDELLRAVGDRLRRMAPAARLLARPGGDEFVVLLDGTPAAAQALAAGLSEGLAQPYTVQGQVLQLGASIGWACSPEDATTADELLRRADLAMYAAKARGRNHRCRYEPQLDQSAAERAWMQRELRAALDAGSLAVHYQPRVDVARGHAPSVEALVRWRHRERGWIPPVQFIPVAEDSGLIERLDAFVLDRALAQRKVWLDAGVDVGRIAVNVSAVELRDPGYADRVLALLQQHGLEPRHLELELTESQFAGDPEAVSRALEPLRRRGVVMALDDFGTGYSSLSALHRLPVDVLKIDRSFVVDLGVLESAEAVVRSVIALARALDKRVVAEGVESSLQEQRLLQLGCDEFQGYRYAMPMPGAQVAAALERLKPVEASVDAPADAEMAGGG